MAKGPEKRDLKKNGKDDQSWLDANHFSNEERDRYVKAARRCGLEVSHWARQTLNAAAHEILDLGSNGSAGKRR